MQDDATAPDAPSRLPLQVVTRRTGLSPDVLRVWERRHGAVQPERSAGRQRLYTETDVARLELLARLTRAGHRIGSLAGLEFGELQALWQQETPARAPRTTPAVPDDERLAAAMACIRTLDAPGLEDVLQGAAVVLGSDSFVDSLLLPLLREVGEQWRAGRLRPSHEHLGTTVARRVLLDLLARQTPVRDAPAALYTTPSGQHHEIGALAAALASATLGWRVTFLGPDVPAADIAATARDVGALVVGLSIACEERPAETCAEVREVVSLLPQRTRVIVGGHGARAMAAELNAGGATVLDDLGSLRALLNERSAAGRR